MTTQNIKGKTYTETHSDLPLQLLLFPDDILNLHMGKYRIIKILGKGGFGSVCKIESASSSKIYAIKIMNLWEMRPDEFEFLRFKFTQGFKAGRFKSPYIVETYNIGSLLGNPYIIMEYCEYQNLESNLAYFQNNNTKCLNLAKQILSGLDTIHKNGIIHRDIKPENILFGDGMTAKLTDFDLSGHLNKRSTYKNIFGYANAIFGTIAYSPPEQLEYGKYFKMTLPSMDMYAFGATMYYVLSGGNNPYGVPKPDLKEIEKYKLRKKTERPIPIRKYNPNISEDWEILLERCLEADPKKRIQNVDEACRILKIELNGAFKESSKMTSDVYLKIMIGDEVGRAYNLTEIAGGKNFHVFKFGRQSDDNPGYGITEKYTSFISRNHFTIEKIENCYILRDGQCVIYNGKGIWKYSRNGTYINNFKLNENNFKKLENGDLIRIGDCVIQFNC